MLGGVVVGVVGLVTTGGVDGDVVVRMVVVVEVTGLVLLVVDSVVLVKPEDVAVVSPLFVVVLVDNILELSAIIIIINKVI